MGTAMNGESRRAIAVLRAIGRVRHPLGATGIHSGGPTVSASPTGPRRMGRQIRAVGSAQLLIHEWATGARGLIPGWATRAPMPAAGLLESISVGVTQTSTDRLIVAERRREVTAITSRVRGRLLPRRRRKALSPVR